MGRTSGVVRHLPWNFRGAPSRRHYADFYVYDELESPLILGQGFLRESDAFVAHEHDFEWLDEESWMDCHRGRLSIIKICSTRADGGSRLHNLFKRKKVDASAVVAAAMQREVTLRHTGVKFDAESLRDHGRAEREMLRRREVIEAKLSLSTPSDLSGMQTQLDQWREDWEMLVALKPKANDGTLAAVDASRSVGGCKRDEPKTASFGYTSSSGSASSG